MRVSFVVVAFIVTGVAASFGCGGGGGGGSGGAGGGGATGSGGSASSSGGAMGSGGSTGSGGGTGSGGAGTGGAPVVDAGAGGATNNDGAMDSSGGNDGGGKSCAGNALSLSANGTGMASDSAQAQVVINLLADTPTGNANRTIEFWAYIKTSDWVGERNQVYYTGGGAGANPTFGLDFGTNPVTGMATNHATLDPFTNGTLSVDSTDYLGISSSAAQWVHVAMTWDGSKMRVYVNGALHITSTATGMLTTGNGPLILGCNPGNMNCFNGLFDEARVWNVARTDAEIMANYNKALVGNETGLVGYWKFDEAPGSASAADGVTSAGHTAHNGTLMAASAGQRPTFVTANPPAPVVCP
ncbi:MAG TPA: LamG domain-containing protein [Polyangia bacterium]|nr:LamG domain-containing protein [Polyangia bacterium]